MCSNRKKGWHDNQGFKKGNLPYWADSGKARQKDRQSLVPHAHGNGAKKPLPPIKDGPATVPNIAPNRSTGRAETSISTVHHHNHKKFESPIRSPYSDPANKQLSVAEIIDHYARASVKQEHANYVDPTRMAESSGDICIPWPDYEGEKTNYAHHSDLFFGLKQGDDGLEIGSVNGSTPHAFRASGVLSR